MSVAFAGTLRCAWFMFVVRLVASSSASAASSSTAAFLRPHRLGVMKPARSLGIVHTFSGLGLDRSRVEAELKEPAAFQAALESQGAAFALFHGTCVLVSTSTGPTVKFYNQGQLSQAFGIALAQLQPSGAPPGERTYPCVALGASDKGEWAFAVDVSAQPKKAVEAQAGDAVVKFQPVRALLGTLSQQDVAVAGLGAATLAWHRQHQHCGVCGSPMVSVEAGGRRSCTSKTCGNRAYPRVDPVAIALVYDPATDSCLLGRQHVYRRGMYSALAGYVSPCESLEEAVRREVKEESGIDVGAVAYHSSQPWPIGRGASCQLMVGFLCEATSKEIKMDTEELEDCRWFTRAEVMGARELVVTAALDATAKDSAEALSIPGPYAIAHHLIKHWLTTPPPPGGRHKL